MHHTESSRCRCIACRQLNLAENVANGAGCLGAFVASLAFMLVLFHGWPPAREPQAVKVTPSGREFVDIDALDYHVGRSVFLGTAPGGDMVVLVVEDQAGVSGWCLAHDTIWLGATSGSRIESREVGSTVTLRRVEAGWVAISFTGTWAVTGWVAISYTGTWTVTE